ncbi:hypothetical protein BKA04_000305 [Cryobacterium mesophilum]|uniref:Heat-shock protein n=1 Tax=Terrimesophilobacter mesophilus TaxID=433647 RepID=A0A4R8VA52_9MICO|nr:DnaJ domain-containing protein [Terrimesophilobacter mesophilus]MBB5632082.1 hypothetical protein [Terrimesophilobacter mesophilus]TFB78960.1 heat-shock protein [Terrimesophilobacter mesophilus]
MTDSPAAPTPYEVLGVAAQASQADLRRAYRRLLRQTHPDTAGDPARFNAVQQAWARIGDAESRRKWDSGHQSSGVSRSNDGGEAPSVPRRSPGSGSAVKARSYGHPGGHARERFLVLMREWAGRGAELADPYDEALVRSAPREIRRLLADALAQESTARAVSGLGIGYTIWSAVATQRGTLDHVILGPAGLFAVSSADWGSDVRLVRGELVGDGIPAGDQPVRSLARAARSLGRTARVRLTATLVVVPDDAITEPITRIGRKNDAAIVRRSLLPMVLRDGLGGQRLSIEDVFDVRSRLQHSIRFV